ncbi:MAG TPA: hypothetical protein VG126_18395 [Thermoleophilaceae bacterium]|nr:hypothetical protein [Thermoleophilaceae bacterium]
MAAHKFADRQKITKRGFLTSAKGDVEDNQRMFWISAYVFQNGPGHHAAASGTKEWPNGKAHHWTCPTEEVPGSNRFKAGEARAWALALVTEGDGRKFYGWGHKVTLE